MLNNFHSLTSHTRALTPGFRVRTLKFIYFDHITCYLSILTTDDNDSSSTTVVEVEATVHDEQQVT